MCVCRACRILICRRRRRLGNKFHRGTEDGEGSERPKVKMQQSHQLGFLSLQTAMLRHERNPQFLSSGITSFDGRKAESETEEKGEV